MGRCFVGAVVIAAAAAEGIGLDAWPVGATAPEGGIGRHDEMLLQLGEEPECGTYDAVTYVDIITYLLVPIQIPSRLPNRNYIGPVGIAEYCTTRYGISDYGI